MSEQHYVRHEIDPIYDSNSRILILGSFPSVKSRESNFFYGHPQNRFWRLLSALFECPLPQTTEEKKVLLAMNKPAGIVCTAEKRERNNIVDYMKYPKRIYPVGRLDKDSTGLLLLTNDGELVNKIMRAGNYHEKEYLVSVNKPVTEEFCRKMSRGVAILDTVTRPCKVEKTGEKSFRIILTQGLNRQIRRMCETLGYRVMTLQRVRIMNIRLGSLKEGTWRNIEGEKNWMPCCLIPVLCP